VIGKFQYSVLIIRKRMEVGAEWEFLDEMCGLMLVKHVVVVVIIMTKFNNKKYSND